MKKDPLIFVQLIEECINRIELYTKGFTKKQFLTSMKTQDSVVHNIEIIGEAAKNISKSFQDEYPAIPWKNMIRTRDKLVHGYFGVDLDITWDVVKREVPKLKKEIQKILQNI